MDLPPNITSIITKINESEDKWKALYMATWGLSYKIKADYEKTEKWEKMIAFGLPASKNKFHTYSPKKLYDILTSRDAEFTVGHLQTLFSLFEDLLNESSNILCPNEINASKWENIKKFFSETDTNDILSDSEMMELKLAKETRNCYLHNGGKIDQRWLDAYKESKGEPIAKINDSLKDGFSNLFYQIEDWHKLIIQLTNKIKIKIEIK